MLTTTTSRIYGYDTAGRMTSRVDGTTDGFAWDAMSNLVASSGRGGNRVYVYDASGQRVAQVVVDALTSAAVASKATVYIGDLEVTDAQPAVVGEGLTATRFFTFGGSTIATETVTGGGGAPPASWALLLGDGQGSAQVSMALVPDATAATGLAPASATDQVLRNAYEPYGAVRGGDHLVTSRGWLGQVSDADTGLVYLNARYYDPALGRFLSPDPLFNPASPKTLDPYRYADNNPVMFTDATGLTPCAGTGANEQKCLDSYNRGMGISKTKPLTVKFAKRFVKAVWKNFLGDALNSLSPVMAFKSTKLLVTDPKAFGNQYVQIWHGVTHLASDWGSQVHTGWNVLNGDASPGNYFSQLWHSDMALNFGDGWDAKDADAVASDYTTLLEIVGGGVGLKGGLGAARAGAADAGIPGIKPGTSGGPTAGQPFTQAVRLEALTENPSTCVYCHMETVKPQVDHSIPRVAGGDATIENAQTTCAWCNASKGAREFPVNPPPGYTGQWPPAWWDNES